MSVRDFEEVIDSLYADTGEAENRDYFEQEVGEVEIPDPEEASKEYLEKHPEDRETYEDLDDDDEKAFESFSPIKMNVQYKEEPIFISNIIKDSAESEDVFQTRKILYEKIKKIPELGAEQSEIYSRIITNKLWFNMKYNNEVENTVKRILEYL